MCGSGPLLKCACVTAVGRLCHTLRSLYMHGSRVYRASWTNKALVKLKELLCTTPLLQPPDISKPFIITTDASGYAVGGILSQGKIESDLPVAYI